MQLNEHGQPIGAHLPDWKGTQKPEASTLEGPRVTLNRLDPALHGDDLLAALCAKGSEANWTYLAIGPFDGREAFDRWLAAATRDQNALFYAILDRRSGAAVGVASYLRIDPAHGSIEVGNLHFSSQLQRTALATEAMYLMMRHVFEDLKYRRYEWKCHALNEKSRAAAERLGFTFEGIFRQDRVVKGCNRDTAWFSILDGEWPHIKAGLEIWLREENFDADGRQINPLRLAR
ncbi:GNAT family protein [Pseudovibrio exalbescens]|uniref:GNAT family N-acetyltransferase n=1 Tax=Pseudovibrio exalbescens TaxID=197461 RepID=UPI0023669588|nr:GNAT family protein [Pseudovibrio exalbescens]MDD7909850.1 GNAT family protein [Pseudovibrio exalbescens]